MKLLSLDNAAEAEHNMRGVRRFLESARQLEATNPQRADMYGAIAADLLQQVVDFYEGEHTCLPRTPPLRQR
jgi:hypothetical protein